MHETVKRLAAPSLSSHLGPGCTQLDSTTTRTARLLRELLLERVCLTSNLAHTLRRRIAFPRALSVDSPSSRAELKY